MALTFNYYAAAGLVTLFDPALYQASDGSTGPLDVEFWIGSTDDTKQLQAASDPGIDNLVLTVTDSAPASGQASSSIILALSEADLDANTPGASLDLGVATLLGGVAEALSVWMRFEASSLTVGQYTDLGLSLSSVMESAI